MKKRTLITKLTLLCAGLLFFASCSNILNSNEGPTSARSGVNGKVTFNGSICVTGALPSSLNETLNQVQGDSSSQGESRSALPSFAIGADYYYYVTATQTDGSGAFNINSIDDSGSFNTSNSVTFALELANGSWNIECGIKKAETSGAASDDDLSVMSDTYPAPLTSANPVVNHTFYPKPSQNGEGKVELKISVYTEISGFDRVTASCSKSVWAEHVSEPEYDGDSGKWIIQTKPSDTLPSGTYEVAFNFYNTSNILLYSTVQTINVFDNMTTNTWVSDGSGAIDGDGTFALSGSLVTSFARTTFYVGQTAAATSVEVTASDITGSGSPYAPFATVTKAASIIAATGNSAKDYRIYVSGTVTGAQEISGAVNGKAKSITIQGYNGLDSSGSPKDALDGGFSWESQGTVLTISSCAVPITIKNLKITGGCNSANGGGISIGGTGAAASQKANLTLESGALITENYIRPAISSGGTGIKTLGAGIYMYYGKLTMKSGSAITKNKTVKNDTISSVYSSGGGIGLNVETEFLMEGGEISENTAYGSGGALCMETNNYSNDILVTLSGGLIRGNECQEGSGGAISNYYGVLKIGGSAYIPYGGAEKSNDIYLASGKTVTLTSPLTAHSASDKIMLSLDNNYYSNGNPLLIAESGVNLANEVGKFKVPQYVSGSIRKDYSLDSEGKLREGLSLPSSYSDMVSGKTYSVTGSSDMQKLAEFSSNDYDFSGVTLKLGADITINSAWTPIGNNVFSGTFDGNEKTVTFAEESNAEAVFGTVYGTVKNLKVAGSTSVAGIAKKAMSSAVIENCESSATVTSSTNQDYCAGIVAVVSSATIKGCVNTGAITSNVVLPADNYTYGAGGITGNVYNGGIIDSCKNTGNVTGPNAGGITGHVDWNSIIRNACNSGNITSTGLHAGGISAISQGNGGEINQASHIDNCFNSGSVAAEGTEYVVYAGGIVGKHGWGNIGCAQNCLNIGSVSMSASAQSGSKKGALFGSKYSSSTVDFCYYKEGCAGDSFGIGGSTSDTANECIKATQANTNDAAISVEVTLNGTSYSADSSTVLSVLNAWVSANSAGGLYLEWEAATNHWPKLKLQ